MDNEIAQCREAAHAQHERYGRRAAAPVNDAELVRRWTADRDAALRAEVERAEYSGRLYLEMNEGRRPCIR